MTGGRKSDRHYLNVSRLLTAVWGVVQIAVAFAAIKLSSRVVDEVLGIASFTNGVILGVFSWAHSRSAWARRRLSRASSRARR